MWSLRVAYPNARHFNKVSTSLAINRFQSGSVVDKQEGKKIKIPYRIHRGSTDILHALAGTVGRDPTAAHYKYHDDPFLIPISNYGKRMFAMSQEAGRKAAYWVRQEHSDLFQHKNADPPIKPFTPIPVFNEESQVDVATLEMLIESVRVVDSMLVYKLLQSSNQEISEETKLKLLELVSFYNHEDPVLEEWTEERWFKQSNNPKDRQRKTWKDADLAEQIFGQLENQNARAYGAIIRGMTTHGQYDKAWALFQDALAKYAELDVNTFNAAIHLARYVKESFEMRWDLIRDLLSQMNKLEIKPNLGTLNAVLQCASTFTVNKMVKQCCLTTLSEFKSLGIEPSLASWYYVLIAFCREKGPVSHVLVDILNEIENKEFTIEDPKDTFFFVTAMDVCRNHLYDINIAKRVHKLLLHGKNYNLIGDSYKESIYYRNYFALMCASEPLEVFMETYNDLVPNVYIPEPGVMAEILKAVEINASIDIIPKIWSDMVIFDHVGRENLISHLLKIMVENRPESLGMENAEEMNVKLSNVAWDIWIRVEEMLSNRTSSQFSWTGQMLSDILVLCCRTSEFEKANAIFRKLDVDQQSVLGAPDPNSIKSFIELAIKEKFPSRAITALEYCIDNGFNNSNELATNIIKSMTLDETMLSKISSLVGKDVVKSAQAN